jgi:tetratricopeptide (TPR) repeat protein
MIGRLLDDARRSRREGRREDARRCAAQAVAAARQEGNHDSLGAALALIGALERDAGELASAASRYEEAAAAARRTADRRAEAHRLRHLGEIRLELAETAEAGRRLDEALALYAAEPDVPPLELANALRPLALQREAIDDCAAAEDLWRQARALYSEAKVAAGVEEATLRLGALGGRK